MAAWCGVERIWVQMKMQQESFRTFSGGTKLIFCTTKRAIQKIQIRWCSALEDQKKNVVLVAHNGARFVKTPL